MKIFDKCGCQAYRFRAAAWLGALLACSPVWGQEGQEQAMRAAAESYARGEYQRSADILDSLYDAGYESTALCYNLGNASFKLGRLGQAILWYERALLLDPRSEDAAYNLKLANARVLDRVATPPEFVLKKWFREYIQNRSANSWAWASIVFIWLAAGTGIAFFWMKNETQRRAGFFSGVLLLFLALLTLSFSLRQRNRIKTVTEAIVMDQNLYVKSEPSPAAVDVFIIHEGLKVGIQETRADWTRIRLADGKTGWAPTAGLEGI